METFKEFLGSRFQRVIGSLIRPVNYYITTRVNSRVEQTLMDVSQDRRALIIKDISMLNELLSRWGERTGTAYFYHYQLGLCHLSIAQREQALLHFESAILSHPNPDDTADFQVYADNYLRTVREISEKDGISHIRGKNRLTGIQHLQQVVESTRKVVRKYPFLESVGRELIAATSHISGTTRRSLY